jgi:hypothetical protein
MLAATTFPYMENTVSSVSRKKESNFSTFLNPIICTPSKVCISDVTFSSQNYKFEVSPLAKSIYTNN